MAERIDVFISSTARDLPAHRKQAMDACMRMGMFPIMMEHLPAVSADAIDVSIAMVDDAEIYLGIYGWRYGYVPEGHEISITEMEYLHAVKRDIPRLIFIMHDDHVVQAKDVEVGENAARLTAFKDMVLKDQVVNFFKSPEELRGAIIHSLVPYRVSESRDLHSRFASEVPIPPEPYIAHPYSLLTVSQIIGRKAELDALTHWATRSDSAVLNFVVAIGGMGKSALTWKWFNEIAPQVIRPLAGRIWWSFYESDARFENFVIRALSYVSKQSIETITALTPVVRSRQLLKALNDEPYLIVLDGLERIMVAYARLDAARLSDEDLDARTANYLAVDLEDTPRDEAQSFRSKHKLRMANDRRIDEFLIQLTQVQQSRILISTRLYPAALQTVSQQPVPGSSAFVLRGLKDEDALHLWNTFGVSGSSDTLLPLFNAFDNYPMLIRALAGEVANDRRSPGDFDRWRQAHPDFNPIEIPEVQIKSHVLGFALSGLQEDDIRVLSTLAAFRMPAAYDTLVALLVGEDKQFVNEDLLDESLRGLEDRSLLGWDRRANRYDLHPIVRGVFWDGLDTNTQQLIYSDLYSHFQNIPQIPTQYAKSLEELTPTIELFNVLIGLQRFDEAWMLYNHRLRHSLYYRLANYHIDVQLLTAIPRDANGIPEVSMPSMQVWTLLYETMCYERTGKPLLAIDRASKAIEIGRKFDRGNLASALIPFAMASLDAGFPRQANEALGEAIEIFEELDDANWKGISHRCLSHVLLMIGDSAGARREFESTKAAYSPPDRFSHGLSVLAFYQGLSSLFEDSPEETLRFCEHAFELARAGNFAREQVGATWLTGAALIAQVELGVKGHSAALETAEEKLNQALQNCRETSMIELESDILTNLAKWYLIQGDITRARDYASQALHIAVECAYRIRQADALNMLAKIEKSEGNTAQAVEFASEAYIQSWCDGPPFTYYWGLKKAREFLDGHKAPYPDLS